MNILNECTLLVRSIQQTEETTEPLSPLKIIKDPKEISSVWFITIFTCLHTRNQNQEMFKIFLYYFS